MATDVASILKNLLKFYDFSGKHLLAAEQRFADFGELEAKVRPQGQESLLRIERFRGRTGIVIPMAYAVALLRRPAQ